MNFKEGRAIQINPTATTIKSAVTLAGSKSFTNRALILAALSDGTTTLEQASLSDDSLLLQRSLNALGFESQIDGSSITIKGSNGEFPVRHTKLYCGAAGSTLRFLTALCALIEGGKIDLFGTERLSERPIADLGDALAKLGAGIEYLNNPGCAPVQVKGEKLTARDPLEISGAISSQFISALLMIAPKIETGLVLNVADKMVSSSYLEMTLSIMRSFGVEVEHDGLRVFRVPCQNYRSPGHYQIEGDASGASYFWGVAAITGGTIRVNNISLNSIQGDVQFIRILEQMGCTIVTGQDQNLPWIEVTGPEKLAAVEVDMTLMPDTAQTLAVLASVAKGKTVISGLSTLRHKETDRIAALCCELSRVGIKTESKEDQLVVYGGEPHGATIKTYEDHRMAMSFAVLGAKISGIEIANSDVISKSYPAFWRDFFCLIG